MMIRRAALASFQIAMETIRGVINHDAVTAASTIAFSLLFALFPFLILIVLAGTAVLGEARALDLEREIMEQLPDYVAKTIKPEVELVLTTRASSGFLTFGILAILFSVSGFVETVRYALNRAYRYEETRSFFHRRATGLLFALGVTLTLISVAALGLVAPLALNLLARYAPHLAPNIGLIEVGRTLVTLLLLTFLLIGMNSLLPSERVKVRSIMPGVILTLILLWMFSRLFVVYLTHFSHFGATYGGLASVIILMLFFELSALALIVGAELNRSIADHSDEPDMRVASD